MEQKATDCLLLCFAACCLPSLPAASLPPSHERREVGSRRSVLKGGVATALSVGGTSFAFIACHLQAHQGDKGELAERNRQAADILANTLPPLRPPPLIAAHDASGRDPTSHFDHVFFMGDFNYRLGAPLDVRRWQTEALPKDPYASAEGTAFRHKVTSAIASEDWHELQGYDQLQAQIDHGDAFCGFDAGTPQLGFPPTFKLHTGLGRAEGADQKGDSSLEKSGKKSKKKLGKLKKLKIDAFVVTPLDLQKAPLEITPSSFNTATKGLTAVEVRGPATLTSLFASLGNMPADALRMFVSPFATVNLAQSDRSVAKIPHAARFFAFIYPIADTAKLQPEQIKALSQANDRRVDLLVNGGYLYIDEYGRTLQVNAINLASKGKPGDLYFDGPYPLNSGIQDLLSKFGRLQNVTFPELIKMGAISFAWVNPNEFGGSGLGSTAAPFGAFAYTDSEQGQVRTRMSARTADPSSLQLLVLCRLPRHDNMAVPGLFRDRVKAHMCVSSQAASRTPMSPLISRGAVATKTSRRR